ncbi:MAG: dienelactone hydrolase family protein [Alphaproteobacteria bacterium]|nr:dienelactone hydrolase family protein [Alphaproteobacteria bacterium]
MGRHIRLEAGDGHALGGYLAEPAGEALGGVIVLQEIFGVNGHIRSICDRLATEGYAALAPALFDRIERDFESGYADEEVTHARGFIPKVDWDATLLDVEAAISALDDGKPKSVVGFCLGGSIAYLAAVRQKGLSASVCFYGGKIVAYADQPPLCPTQMHFGEQDHGIPMSDVETIRTKREDCEIHVYPAGHGFNCDERASYHAPSADLAWARTLAFLRAHARA